MDDFNWVKMRAECSLPAVFERLKAQLQQDVDERKTLLERGPEPHYGLKLVINGKNAAVVLDGNGSQDSVLFRLADTAIEIIHRSGKVLCTATPTLNDEGQCRLIVEGKERELWHFRKMGLEELFFRKS
ncbi:MAG: hypothetical protein WBC78_12235 [Candidatus Sulfotelmatobacter sp.]